MPDPRLDALELEHLATSRGLPRVIAETIGRVVARSALSDARRLEVFEEMVAHFEDGLSAGRQPADLVGEFGDATLAPISTPQALEPPRRGDSFMSRFVRDARYAVRRLSASPGFTLVAILSLALGIGAGTAVFSLVNAVIFRKSPIAAVEEVLNVYESSPGFHYNAFNNPDFAEVVNGTKDVFTQVVGVRYTFAQIMKDGLPSRATGEMVTGQYFPMVGIRPAMGRLLGPEDDVSPGGHYVVVLGNGYWRRVFGGASDVIGKTLTINGSGYTIVGVTPDSYEGNIRGIVPDFFAPMMMINQLTPADRDVLQDQGAHGLFVRARLRPGATQPRAEAALANVATELRKTQPQMWRAENTFLVVPTRDVVVFPGMDGVLSAVSGLLFTVVGLVLLVVCANLASFLLARALDRRKEIAVRLSLGASRGQLVSQLLTETLILGLLGGLGGLAVASVIARFLTTADLPLPIPLTLRLGLDFRALLFATGVSAVAGVLFGLLPALRASNPHLATTLRDESAGGGGRGRLQLRNALVAAQVGVSLVLLVAAGLFLRSLNSMRDLDPGFGRQPAGLLQVAFPITKYPTTRQPLAQRQFAERIRALPGVTAVGLIDNMPLNLLNTQDWEINSPGVNPPAGSQGFDIDVAVVDTGFFSAAGIKLLKGRDFVATDGDTLHRVVIVNEATARAIWNTSDPIGKHITQGTRDLEVVGMVATTKIRSLGETPRTGLYVPLAQLPSSAMWYLASTSGDAEALSISMLRMAHDFDPDLLPVEVRTMARHLDVVRLPIQLGALVIGGLALLAVLLATIGLYGTVRYAVAQRSREVGIRLALGAETGAMVRLLMGSGIRLVIWGSLAGLLISVVLARLISGLLFGVPALDPVTFVAGPVLLAGVAAIAAWLPARRVIRVAPTEALRSD